MLEAEILLKDLIVICKKSINACDVQMENFQDNPIITSHAQGCKSTLETVKYWAERILNG